MHPILEQAGGSMDSRTETCRPRPRQQIGNATIGRREAGILRIIHGLTIREISFSELGPVSVDWRKTSRQPTGCVNRTRTHTARTDAHSTITFRHANTRGSRA